VGNIFYLSFSLILAGLFVCALRLKNAPGSTRKLLLLAIAGLLYDNGITGMGFLIGEGQVLKALSMPRFVLHVLVTPLICVIAYELARGFRVALAERPEARWIVLGLTAVLVVIGFLQELSPLHLVPKTHLGVLRYSHPVPAPPLAAIVVNFFTIAASVLIWRRTGWPVVFITSVLMLLLAGFPQKYFSLIPGNAGEIIFMAGFMLALKRLAARNQPVGQSP